MIALVYSPDKSFEPCRRRVEETFESSTVIDLTLWIETNVLVRFAVRDDESHNPPGFTAV